MPPLRTQIGRQTLPPPPRSSGWRWCYPAVTVRAIADARVNRLASPPLTLLYTWARPGPVSSSLPSAVSPDAARSSPTLSSRLTCRAASSRFRGLGTDTQGRAVIIEAEYRPLASNQSDWHCRSHYRHHHPPRSRCTATARRRPGSATGLPPRQRWRYHHVQRFVQGGFQLVDRRVAGIGHIDGLIVNRVATSIATHQVSPLQDQGDCPPCSRQLRPLVASPPTSTPRSGWRWSLL